MKTNCTVNVYKNSAVIYEGEPPADLKPNLEYSEDAKFKITSTVELPESGNTVTITGELDGEEVSEEITCEGFYTEGSSYFDKVESFVFDFDDSITNIQIKSINENGDSNPTLILKETGYAVSGLIRSLIWSKTLFDMGVLVDKSKRLYLPAYLDLDTTDFIEYNEEYYKIVQLYSGRNHQELIITRLE